MEMSGQIQALAASPQGKEPPYRRLGGHQSQSECGMVKIKMSLCLCKYHAMKIYGVVEVQLHPFLTLALGGGKWS
jgi:hypothetical protein